MGTMISDPLVGQVLDGRYRVDSRIARGGMATVYRAQDTRLDRTVALKAMHPSLAEDESFVSRFIGEAKSAARLSHPNVVSVYDQGSDAGAVFLTMEYLPGHTARDLLTERGRLHPDEALRITEAVLSALGAAHQAGYVHRDVKPENVLLSPDGGIKVGDFGLARAIAESNHTKTSGLLIGTVAYLSPEQVAHGAADARSDVYSAGILLFELLTGVQPFGGETPISVAYKHVNEDVPPPSSLIPDLPGELDALVAAATRRDPDSRPSDASGLLALTQRVRTHLQTSEQAATEGHTLAIPQERSETLIVPREDVVPGLHQPDDPADGSDGEPEAPQQARKGSFLRGRRGWIALACVLILALVAGGAGWYYGWGRWTHAPTLAGLDTAKATQKAERLGFEVDTAAPQFSKTVPEGHVISTEPQAGESILEGGALTLVPSKGKKKVAVPNVSGQSLAAAKDALRDAQLKVGEVTRGYSPSVPTGKVISTDPGHGKKITVGSAVDITQSAGVQVPNLVGEPVDEATAALEGKGFAVEVIEERYDPEADAGTVIVQTPSSGGASQGSTIELVVSKGPKPVAVPDVLGMEAEQATQVLENAGFEVEVKDFPIPGSTINLQRPSAGSKQPPGTTITIYAW